MVVESLSKMPSDIILHIFEQADTRDIQSLAETNRIIREVSGHSKSPWINHAIRLLRSKRTLYLPAAEYLSDYGLPQLRSAVCRAARLEANWSSDSPKFTLPHAMSFPPAVLRMDSIKQMCYISPECVLLYTTGGIIQVFNFKHNALVGFVKYRTGIVVRDCKVQYENNVTHIFCLVDNNSLGLPNGLVNEQWSHAYLQIDAPSITSIIREFTLKELCRFTCPGSFLSGAILDVSNMQICVITDSNGSNIINFLYNCEKGEISSKAFESDNSLKAFALAYISRDRILLHDVYPNKTVERIAELSYQDSLGDENRSIDELRVRVKSTFKLNSYEDDYYPITSENMADRLEFLKIYRNVLFNQCANIPEDLQNVTSIAVLADVSCCEGDDFELDEDTLWVLMQHYTSSDGPCSGVCVVQLKSPKRKSDIPVMGVSFNHAAWVEVNEDSSELRLATFTRNDSDSDNGGTNQGYREAHVVTLDAPIKRSNNNGLVYLDDIDDIIIDEAQGIILYLAYRTLYTLHYA